MKIAFKPKATIYVPVDEILRQPRTRILRRLQHFDWVTADDLFFALDVPDYDSSRNTVRRDYANHLRLVVAAGLVIKDASSWPYRYRLAPDVDLTIPAPNLDGYMWRGKLRRKLDTRRPRERRRAA